MLRLIRMMVHSSRLRMKKMQMRVVFNVSRLACTEFLSGLLYFPPASKAVKATDGISTVH